MCLGVPGKIIETYDNNGLKMGKVDFGGVMRETCLEYVPEAAVGDYTIIHVGFAISLLSEEEANETLELLKQMVDLEDEIGPEMTIAAANAANAADVADAADAKETSSGVGGDDAVPGSGATSTSSGAPVSGS